MKTRAYKQSSNGKEIDIRINTSSLEEKSNHNRIYPRNPKVEQEGQYYLSIHLDDPKSF